MTCKHCGFKSVVPRFHIESNDNRMTGDYCSYKCMDTRRAELPPFIAYVSTPKIENSKFEKVFKEATEKKLEKEMDLSGLNKLFG
jgi:hypothetical protein